MSKISVVIPVFNVELYLSKCLDSIINQTYKNLEIICINDGSTDNSLNILKEYKEKDNRIIIIDQKNIGAAATRNKGIDTATGDYIYFMDSDDWVDLDFFEKLYNTSIKENADIVSVNTINYLQNNDTYAKAKTSLINIDLSIENNTNIYINLDEKINIFTTNNHVATCKHFYKIDLIKNNNIRFPENIIGFEDQPFNFACIFYANKLITEDKDIPYYYYRVRNDSLSTASRLNKSLYLILSFKNILNFCNEHNHKINNELKYFILNAISSEFPKATDKKEFFDYIVFYLSKFFTLEELENIKLKYTKIANSKKYIKLFNLMPIITIKKKNNKNIILLFGLLPILTIRNRH